MSNPQIGFVLVSGGLVTHAPDDVPVFDLDVLDKGNFNDDDDRIAEARDLRERMQAYLDDMDADQDYDRRLLTECIADCDTWLNQPG